eukprot:CAMPEP_0119472854 /NCGR_PEP_ID=MMETSP1344-20130328/4754_1 /TAXON_ID=236787 /ORGANISM="Florenciella parvula, Strain CCMP2471" /LENGTH=163 /DNA_ID=CAMNT_0007505885 /DNA_START=28 /DNA_END=516 /DNA_ORIENTATION=-
MALGRLLRVVDPVELRVLETRERARERDGEMERWRDGEMERWRDGEMERWAEAAAVVEAVVVMVVVTVVEAAVVVVRTSAGARGGVGDGDGAVAAVAGPRGKGDPPWDLRLPADEGRRMQAQACRHAGMHRHRGGMAHRHVRPEHTRRYANELVHVRRGAGLE